MRGDWGVDQLLRRKERSEWIQPTNPVGLSLHIKFILQFKVVLFSASKAVDVLYVTYNNLDGYILKSWTNIVPDGYSQGNNQLHLRFSET